MASEGDGVASGGGTVETTDAGPVAGGADAGAGGGGAEGGDAGAGGGGDAGKATSDTAKDVDASWYGALSDEADEGVLSDAAWMKNKGYADLPAMLKAMRGLEAKVGAKAIEAPGEDASAEQVAAYRKAIGVPEAVDGYALDIPEGWEADMAMFQPLREAAFAGGMPEGAWKALTEAYKTKIIDDHNAMVDAQNGEREAVLREWGAAKDANLVLFKRGMATLGLKPEQATAVQTVLGEGGTRQLMALGVKLGQLTEEDRFVAPTERKASGMSLDTAKRDLAALEKSREHFDKVRSGDKTAIAKQNALIEFIASEEVRRRREAA